jgi:hypothetical protein
MAVALMLAQKPQAMPVKRTLLHDLEGYYYVILTLAFMFDEPYGLKPLPDLNLAASRESWFRQNWLRHWLQNTWPDTMDIWAEAEDKKKYFGTDEGFQEIQDMLGAHWNVQPIHDMLSKMRHLLFGPPDLVTHVNMLDIIETALLAIRTDYSLSHLCTPVDMTWEWRIATGGKNVAHTSCDLPALRTNRMHQGSLGDADINLFSRMPLPPKDNRHLWPEISGTKLLEGKTTDYVRVAQMVGYDGRWNTRNDMD